jgi:hypothetical protein
MYDVHGRFDERSGSTVACKSELGLLCMFFLWLASSLPNW